MNKEEEYSTEFRPLKSLDKGTIISLWNIKDKDKTDVVIIPHTNCYTKNTSDGYSAGNRIVGVSSKTGDTYKESMGKNYRYKILKF